MTDAGYFPRGASILRKVHEEHAVGLLFGQRALGIGALAPANFIGTRLHSRWVDQPFRRLAHTGKMFETIFFGTRAQADEVLEVVARMHDRVNGELPEDAGPLPAGTPYSAYDPEMMLWTIAVMADSAKTIYELFVGRLSASELDRFWDDYVRFGELFGMPRDVAPRSWDEFRAWYQARLRSDEMFLTDEARIVGRAIMFSIPVPRTHQPAMRIHNFVIRGSLPGRVRELYGIGWSPAQEAAFQAITRALRAPRPLTPRRIATGLNTEAFDLVARSEQRLLAAGRPVPGAL